MRKLLLLLLVLAVLLCGCGKQQAGGNLPEVTAEPTTLPQEENREHFSDRDYEVGYDADTSAVILLNGDSAQCSSDAVMIDGTTVTILDEGTYILSGSLNDGMIIVNSEKTDKTQLVLDNVTIH